MATPHTSCTEPTWNRRIRIRCSRSAPRSRPARSWPSWYATRSSPSWRGGDDVRATVVIGSPHLDLVGTRGDQGDGADAHVRAPHVALGREQVERQHVVHAGDLVELLQDLGPVHVPAEGPADPAR